MAPHTPPPRPQDDPRVALRGQRGVYATADIPTGAVVGTYKSWAGPRDGASAVGARAESARERKGEREREKGRASVASDGGGDGQPGPGRMIDDCLEFKTKKVGFAPLPNKH